MMDEQEVTPDLPMPIQPKKSDAFVDKHYLAGAIWGGVGALLVSMLLIGLAMLVEQRNYGHQNWDHAIGIVFFPVVMVPIGVVLGTVVGAIVAALRRE